MFHNSWLVIFRALSEGKTFAGQKMQRAEECDESEIAVNIVPDENSVEKQMKRAEEYNERVGNIQEEDFVEQPTEETTVIRSLRWKTKTTATHKSCQEI